jgi:hypothetical protein
MNPQTSNRSGVVPRALKSSLLSIAEKVFWWGKPEEWVQDTARFAAQVMTYGDWEDVRTTLNLLGKDAFLDVLNNPPAGVFDQKSWTFWHRYYCRAVPPLPVRKS